MGITGKEESKPHKTPKQITIYARKGRGQKVLNRLILGIGTVTIIELV